MSFTTRCTSTATSSLVSAMLAAGRLGSASGTAQRDRRGSAGSARVRPFGGAPASAPAAAAAAAENFRVIRRWPGRGAR